MSENIKIGKNDSTEKGRNFSFFENFDPFLNDFPKDTSDQCSLHFLEFNFFCLTERVPLCRICIDSHVEDCHKVWHKTDIIEKHILTINDISKNKEKLLSLSKKSEKISVDLKIANKTFQKIIKKPRKTWYEKVEQVFELLDMSFPSNPEMHPFENPFASLTSNMISYLSTSSSSSSFSTMAYVTRGTSDCFTYDFNTQEFRILKTSKKILKWSGIIQNSSKTLIVTGGKHSKEEGSTNDCFELNVEDGSINTLEKMLSSHSSHVNILWNGYLYVISGKNNNNSVSTQCEKLDLESLNWSSIENNQVGRTCASGSAHKGNLFIIGGCKNSSIEKYDVKENIWSLVQVRLFDIIWQHLSVSVGDKILVFGGDSANDAPTRYSYLLDPETAEVSDLETLPVSQCWLCEWYPSLVRGNRIWIMSKELKFLSYNIDTQEWRVLKNSIKRIR
jgi:hypothetical protein